MFYGSLFVLLPFFLLAIVLSALLLLAIMYCPPFFFWPSCIVRHFSFGHHVLSALLLLAIMYCPPFFFWPSCIVRPFSFGHHVLSALLRFTVSDRHLCIFTLSCDDLMYINLNNIIVPGTIRIMGV